MADETEQTTASQDEASQDEHEEAAPESVEELWAIVKAMLKTLQAHGIHVDTSAQDSSATT